MPKSFTITFDSHDWNGVNKWQHTFYQIHDNLWKETILKNDDLKLIQYVTNEVVYRYHKWGYNKNKKTGVDYRNIEIIINQ